MLRKVLVAGATVALGVGALSAAPSSANQAGRASLGANADWATASARIGAYDANAQVPVRVYLQLRNEADADAFVASVSDPTSPNYHHYMTAAQFHAAYSPTAASVAQVESWLRGAGLAIGDVPANNMFVPALGTAKQVERAFAVHLSNYRVQGQVVRGADTAPTVPASVAS
ncbi:MAG TPA: protease pro-enzyme activation domain-containing protein, partial [Acidimicrobiia bacterium]